MTLLLGRRAIVTGASDGMGQAIATLFSAHGARVIATARSAERLERAHGADEHVLTLAADLNDASSASRLVSAALERLGGIDIVVNCAAMFELSPVGDLDRRSWERMFALNVTAPMELCVAALPALRDSLTGRIINIGSVSTRMTQSGMSAYNASKHALTGFTKSLAIEVAGDGITANIIVPGTVLTGMTRALIEDPGARAHFVNKVPAGRVGAPEEIASAALYLASDGAAYTTGLELIVDGGYSTGFHLGLT